MHDFNNLSRQPDLLEEIKSESGASDFKQDELGVAATTSGQQEFQQRMDEFNQRKNFFSGMMKEQAAVLDQLQQAEEGKLNSQHTDLRSTIADMTAKLKDYLPF